MTETVSFLCLLMLGRLAKPTDSFVLTDRARLL
jgi:hypothetical protein